MNKFVASTVAAALAMIPTLAAAHEAEPRSFTRDGQTYVYTSTVQKSGQVIDGYSQTSGDRFHLVVRNGVVSGLANGRQVSFRVPSAARPVETAAR